MKSNQREIRDSLIYGRGNSFEEFFGETKMTEQNNTGRAPDFKGDGVAVWVNQDKNGKQYLSISLLGSVRCAAFKYEPRQEEVKPTSANEVNMNKLV